MNNHTCTRGAFPVVGRGADYRYSCARMEFSHWEGSVAEPGQAETTVQLDDDMIVSAVFITDNGGNGDDDPANEGLIDRVAELVATGTVNGGQGRALMSSLKAASRSVERGNVNTACNVLRAFINQVEAYIKAGIVSPEDGSELIAHAEALIGQPTSSD